jgi:uncharacterized protein (TIGR02246 family)
MRFRRVPSVVFALALVLTACQPGVAPLSDEDVAQIESVVSSISQAALAGDWDAVVELFTEDAVLMPPNSPVIRGSAALKSMIESFNPNFTAHSIELREIDGYGDIAYAWANYTETFTVEGVPEPIEEVAKLMFVFRKQPDGSWAVAAEIWNSDLPLPTGEGEHPEGEEHT